MFYFLPESKRSKIIVHPSLQPLLLRNDIKGFLSALGAFSGELRITQDEIRRIEKYLEALKSHIFKQLSERIFREAGFEVFHHAGDRPDLNDWNPNPKCYIRAVHNLIGHTRYAEFLGSSPQTLDRSGAPYDLILKHAFEESHQIIARVPSTSTVNAITDRYLGISPIGLPDMTKVEIRPPERAEKVLPNYLKAWGCGKIIYGQESIKVGEIPKKVLTPYQGMLGSFSRFGLKERKTVMEPKYENRTVEKGLKMVPLNEIVGNTRREIPYFLQFCVQKYVPEAYTGRANTGPHIYLICGKSLADELVSFLLQNPDNYLDLLMGFIPKESFPNVNRGILSPPFYPTKGIVFENYTSGQQIIVP